MFSKKIILFTFIILLGTQFSLAQSATSSNAKSTAKTNVKKSKKKSAQNSNEIPLLKDAKSPIVKDALSGNKSKSTTPGEEKSISNSEKSSGSSSVNTESKDENKADDDNYKTKTHRQWVLSVASWRENSILTKQDRKIKVNTLNVAGRMDRLIYFLDNRLYFNFGIIAGQSENMNAESDFTYFQRQVMLSGLEFQLGAPLFRRGGAELALSLGGLARVINHALPGSDYKFTTATRFVPLLAFDFTWQIFQRFFFHQSIGTTGVIGDTFWSAGFGLDI